MADINEQILTTLRGIRIDMGKAAESIGAGRGTANTGVGTDKKKGSGSIDKFGEETDGLFKRFKLLSKAADAVAKSKAEENLAIKENTKLQDKTTKTLGKLTKTVDEQRKGNDSFLKNTGLLNKNISGMISGVQDQIKASGNMYDETGDLGIKLKDLNKELVNSISINNNVSKELGALHSVVQSQIAGGKDLNAIRRENIGDIAALNKVLVDSGYDADILSKAMDDAGNNADEFASILKAGVDSVQSASAQYAISGAVVGETTDQIAASAAGAQAAAPKAPQRKPSGEKERPASQ